ncbi:MAG: hypothetical protein JSS96_00450 [Bacteroidetes bacterium]|nr:hypothetical protein [Bacteroidota bacterium]
MITAYWDDMLYFLQKAEKSERVRARYDTFYITALNEISQSELKEKIPNLPPFERRGIRYAILSSFLFLEAFINSEYYRKMNFENSRPDDLTKMQKKNLDTAVMKTPFEDKWSKWISEFVDDENLQPKNHQEFKNLDELRKWRNELTHYKLHHLKKIHNEIETIENARESVLIVIETINWYYRLLQEEPADWMAKDMEYFASLSKATKR